tara:strand:- start:12222 stop:13814 length:1593 start_codon:yes stop_codon:yes gene_type:complete
MFRSTIDYTDKLASSGCCCVPGQEGGVGEGLASDAENTTAFRTTYTNCVSQGGYFSPSDDDDDCSGFVCPDNNTKGCCCACSHMTAEEKNEWLKDPDQPLFGTKDGISPCECTRLGGNWGDYECSELDSIGRQTLCFASGEDAAIPGSPNDVRWPSACCVYDEDGNIRCENACTPEDCLSFGQLSIYYDDGSVCGYAGPDGQSPRYCESSAFGDGDGGGSEQRSGSIRDIIDNIESSCTFINSISGNPECGRMKKSQCDVLGGFFAGTDQDMNPIPCNEFPSIIKTKELNISKITEEQANEIPIGGDFYGLGIYCGIYEPGISVIQGTDTNTGITSSMTSPLKTKGSVGKNKHKKIIIMSYRDFGWGNFGTERNKVETSSWDGKHNIYSSTGLKGNLVNAIKNFKSNGIGGWSVPSVEECGFIQESMMTNPETYLALSVDYMRGKLLRSTPNDFNVPSFYTTLTSTVINIGGVYYSKGYSFVQIGDYGKIDKERGYRSVDIYPYDQSNIIMSQLDQPMAIRLIKTIKVVD